MSRQVRPSDPQALPCPRCEKPGKRITQPDEKLPERDLTTRAGDVKLRREKWHCPKCRNFFFHSTSG
jgi:transposase